MGDDGCGQECDGQLQRASGADRACLAARTDQLEQHLQLDGSEWSHILCAGSVRWEQHTHLEPVVQRQCGGLYSDTSCDASPSSLATLGNGDYTWRVRDYATVYGYGAWTSPMAFTLNTACYSLTTGIAPVGAGTVTASPGAELWGQLCSGDGGEVDGSGQ